MASPAEVREGEVVKAGLREPLPRWGVGTVLLRRLRRSPEETILLRRGHRQRGYRGRYPDPPWIGGEKERGKEEGKGSEADREEGCLTFAWLGSYMGGLRFGGA